LRALDCRLRGNDGEEGGNDGEGSGNEGRGQGSVDLLKIPSPNRWERVRVRANVQTQGT
jgi:hypothetical protein